MDVQFTIGIVCVALALAVIVMGRLWLKREIRDFPKKLARLSPYADNPPRDVKAEGCGAGNRIFKGMGTDLENRFADLTISGLQEADFARRYADMYREACSLAQRCKAFGLGEPGVAMRLIRDYETLHEAVCRHNERVIQRLLDVHKDFFDHCLSYPLDEQQRRSIVSEEDNCLVVSSAGSGKTSSIVGKVKYLIEVKHVDPRRILLISYTNKAAAELTDRVKIAGLRGYTFHKLAIDLIGRATGVKPSICDASDALFVHVYRQLLNEPSFKRDIVEYVIDYQTSESAWERQRDERREQLSAQKSSYLRALLPDMDGKSIYVRSEQEQKICFILSSLGVRFRYEEPYEHPLADETHAQYKPDFSIYYERGGKTRRIYLEHFGIDDHGLVPAWFAKDKNLTYEEANQQYNDGITWKKAAHEKFGTVLLTTSSADFHYTDVKEKLKELLRKEGVPLQEKPESELYDLILPSGSKPEKAFIRLVVTFIILAKSSCKSYEDVLRQAVRENDERALFIIRNIIRPVYDGYRKALECSGQIDFTDAILQATALCRSGYPVSYDYIIVDEFQDISVDRYHFLKVLREGNPPAKLYCVGDDWQSIYRFSGSDMALFNRFADYFGPTDVNKIETTYRFGEPLVSWSSQFIQRNEAQLRKDIHPANAQMQTELAFYAYDRRTYDSQVAQIIAQIPADKSIFLLGRYSFDDYYLSFAYPSVKRGNKFFYVIEGREIEFLTVHKSKGLEADYVILLQCNKDTYGFPSLVSDDPILHYVLTEGDRFPYGEERRLFYVALTRAKVKTIVLYDSRNPSVFVDEYLHPETLTEKSYAKHPNANKRWTRGADRFLLQLYQEGKSIKYIAAKMGRSQTAIRMRLELLNKKKRS